MFSLPLPLHNVCPGHEQRIPSPSLPYHAKEQGLAAVDSAGRRGRNSEQKRRSRSNEREIESEKRRRQRGRLGSGGGERQGSQSPISEQREKSQEDRRTRWRTRESQSLPRDAFRKHDESDTEKRAMRWRKRGKERGRSTERGNRSEERVRVSEDEEPEQEEEKEVQEEEEKSEGEENKMQATVDLEGEESDEEVFLPITSPTQKLPRPKQNWEGKQEENWDMVAKYRELRKESEEGQEERSQDDNDAEHKDLNGVDDASRHMSRAAAVDLGSQRKPFSFLTSTLSVGQLGDDESESEGSQSDGSVSAASISGLSLAVTEAGGRRPGPWLPPSQQRLAQAVQGNRRPRKWTGQTGRRNAVS